MYKLMIKNKQRSYKEQKLKQISNLMDSEVKKKWSIIKSIISTKDICDPAENITMDRWKLYFEKLGTNGQENDNFPDFNHRVTDNEILNKLSQEINKPVTEIEIKVLAREKLPNSKAVGLDRIRNEIMSSCLQNKQFLDIFKQLSNKIMDSGIYPNKWKIDLIKPIHKKDATSKETNYRGISLSSCIGKFFNNLILNRLSKSFEELDLFYPHLMGFRPGMRTSNNIFVLKTLIDKQFKKGGKLYCCFVDFSKAFDTIWRKGLLAKVKSYGIDGKILNVIESQYSGNVACVKVGNLLSESFKVFIGVKQGDPPSPFSFNIYMNDLRSDLLNSNNIDTPKISDFAVPCLFWADYLVLISESRKGLQQHLNVLEKYCKDW